MVPMWSEYYTTDIEYLNDTKYLIKNFKHIQEEGISYKDVEKIDNICKELQNETGFYEKI